MFIAWYVFTVIFSADMVGIDIVLEDMKS